MSQEHVPAVPVEFQGVRRRPDGEGPRRYWKSLDELADAPAFLEFLHREFPEQASMFEDPKGRREFLTLMGASLALAGLTACTKQPEERIYPYVRQPEGLVPGRPLFFASACGHDGFARGISTNAGGAWTQLALPDALPRRYISGLAIDPADASGRTAYVAFNGFSRTWIEGPGAGLGHLWKTANAGASWSDVSGNLPDVPLNDVIVLGPGKLVVASDLGVMVSTTGGATWSRLGSNLPYTTAMDIHAGPDGRLYAATHGRGVWSIARP